MFNDNWDAPSQPLTGKVFRIMDVWFEGKEGQKEMKAFDKGREDEQEREDKQRRDIIGDRNGGERDTRG